MKLSFDPIKSDLLPKDFHHWRMFILLSLLAWLCAWVTDDPVRELLTWFGWSFLIIGVGWRLEIKTGDPAKKPLTFGELSLGPWITGILICCFVADVATAGFSIPRWLVISWPLFATLVAIFPFIFEFPGGFKLPKVGDRPYISILVLSNLLLIAWILFFYHTQDWLLRYPALYQENFSDSRFVTPVGFRTDAPNRGAEILEVMAGEVRRQNQGRPRSEVERWLLQLREASPANSTANAAVPTAGAQFSQQVLDRLRELDEQEHPGYSDQNLWQLAIADITAPEYTVVLEVQWQGPSSGLRGYTMTQSCRIQFESDAATAPADVVCEEPREPDFGLPTV
ncbi:MAG: DUF5357 family protein [Cyanobacteria bacterium P01_H01_bin.121]